MVFVLASRTWKYRANRFVSLRFLRLNHEGFIGEMGGEGLGEINITIIRHYNKLSTN
jgi:hypothetical protein